MLSSGRGLGFPLLLCGALLLIGANGASLPKTEEDFDPSGDWNARLWQPGFDMSHPPQYVGTINFTLTASTPAGGLYRLRGVTSNLPEKIYINGTALYKADRKEFTGAWIEVGLPGWGGIYVQDKEGALVGFWYIFGVDEVGIIQYTRPVDEAFA